MKKNIKNRNINVDVIKFIAVLLVICSHFLLYINFSMLPLKGGTMHLFLFLRPIFLVCISLFIITTGYLMYQKKLSTHYYKGLLKTLIIYIIISIISYFFRKFYLHDNINLWWGILNFNVNVYAWYVDMYIGLFLLIPFLNIIYLNLDSKKIKQMLIITLIIISFLPPFMSLFSNVNNTWWANIYPLTYYFIGAYIHEYKIKIDIKKNSLLIITLLILTFLKTILLSKGTGIFLPLFDDSGLGINSLILGTLFFIFLINLDFNKTSNLLKKGIIKISELTLNIYLCSYIADSFLYPMFKKYAAITNWTLIDFLILVPFSFFVSIILALIVDYIYKLAMILLLKITEYIDKEKVYKIKTYLKAKLKGLSF